MNTNRSSHVALFWLAAVLLTPVTRQGASDADNGPKGPAPSNSGLKFRPLTASAPPVRVTGGSRGTGSTVTTLDVLAPDDVGLTTEAQPSLFWFQSMPAEARFELTLVQENKPKPLVRVEVERSTQAGIQRLKLSDKGVKLAPGVEYQWVVALISDPDNRSTDLIASGVIKRIEPTDDLKKKLAHSSPDSLPNVYADAGIWYDTLAALSDQIDAHPENRALRQTRADLLRQVGLKAAATAEDASAQK